MGYAAGTSVSVSKTIGEIQRLLEYSGTAQFGYMCGKDAAAIAFARDGISYKIALPLPNRDHKEFTHTPTSGKKRDRQSAQKFYEDEVKRKWRALGAVIKAKVIAVDEGVVEFESEFLAHAVLSNGQTMFEHAAPALEASKRGEGLVLALPGGGS